MMSSARNGWHNLLEQVVPIDVDEIVGTCFASLFYVDVVQTRANM